MKKLKFITGVSRAALLLFFLYVSFEGYSQLVTNPSFEGHPAAMNQAPFPWAPCKTFSTPDTQPGVWDVSTAPSHGISFLGLVTRGNLGPYANTTEAAQVQLTTKLKSKSKYDFSIDLAFSTSLGHFGDQNFVSYASPTILKVWVGSKQLRENRIVMEISRDKPYKLANI